MPDMSDLEPVSAARFAAELAAMTEHLGRIGIRFVPRANPQSATSLASRFERPPEAETTIAGPDPPLPAPNRQSRSLPGASGKSSPAKIDTRRVGGDPLPAVAVGVGQQQRYGGDSLPVAERAATLNQLAEQVAGCTRCSELVRCRTQTVFGEGAPAPRVVFFGEGPGAEEDRSGRPFVGRAGQLLTKMIEACSFRREDVYILNTVKCRPPNNRNPEPDEIENCREYFEQQLSILRPEYIVCLGAVSSRALLRSKLSVGRLRGRLHQYFDSKVLVTYHPAYLLRTPAAKKAAWDDLQLMLRDAGIDPRTR